MTKYFLPGGRSITVNKPVLRVLPPELALFCNECTSSGDAIVCLFELPLHCIYLKRTIKIEEVNNHLTELT